MTKVLSFLVGLATLLCVTSDSGRSAVSRPWIDAVRRGGHVIVIRHVATNQDQADLDPLNYGDMTRQRQLTAQGRATAKSIGDSMRKLNIPVGLVQTSMFFRAIETGRLLGFGDVRTLLDLTEGGLVVSPRENNRRAETLRRMVALPPPLFTNSVIVSHKPNIMDAFGRDWFDLPEGEATIFKPNGDGTSMVIGRVPADEWLSLARANN
jgi:phosphohistidine phosphatase SixA